MVAKPFIVLTLLCFISTTHFVHGKNLPGVEKTSLRDVKLGKSIVKRYINGTVQGVLDSLGLRALSPKFSKISTILLKDAIRGFYDSSNVLDVLNTKFGGNLITRHIANVQEKVDVAFKKGGRGTSTSGDNIPGAGI
ncbi:unnamed protein product [Lactuca virosa]|uniref:Uncharacterized protein n=1 Tax=Lactuca virosa TaxID=75947 RepID=A0AAU9MSU3_9ASTR|nr:unnamed protein product [Lactuca virosa]